MHVSLFDVYHMIQISLQKGYTKKLKSKDPKVQSSNQYNFNRSKKKLT